MTIYDITQPISGQLPVWPGDPPVVVESAGGSGATPAVSRLSLGSHTGTHVDSPAHFIPGGTTVDRLRLDVLVGPAWVVHLSGPGPLAATDLEAAAIPLGVTRLLLRTRNSERPACPGFDTAFVGLATDAAGWLLRRSIWLVGIDAPSIEPYDTHGEPVHRALLGAGVVIVEGLALSGIASGFYQLICLPLCIAGGDGAPARVVLEADE